MNPTSSKEKEGRRDPDDLSLWILRECTVSTIDALRSTVGKEGTKSALAPYFINSCKAFIINMRGKVAEDELGIKILKTWLWANNAFTGAARSCGVGKSEVLLMNYGCPFEGRGQEICHVACRLGAEAMMGDIRPDCSFHQTPAHETTDHSCTWQASWNEEGPAYNPQARIFDAREYLDLWTEEEWDWLRHHVTAEFLLSAIRALVDQIGADDATVALEPFMREAGTSVFSRLNDEEGSGEKDLRTASTLINRLNMLEKQIGSEIDTDDDVVSKSVVECPFCDSPEIFCRQYEVMCDEICKRISPDLSFRYESMITRGDPNCVWVISSKGSVGTNDQKIKAIEPTSQAIDPLRVLLQRLAKGEISKQEYEELKTFISSELRAHPER
jgi:predicted ArsR family transcriptional regulator